jgi:osmotically-inducible protein OsmY
MKSDRQIREEVMDQLKTELGTDSTQVEVTVLNGIAGLSGTLPTFLKKQNAEKAALRVIGLKAIAEKIIVKRSALTLEDDREIANAILEKFEASSLIPDEQLKVIVSGGDVTLLGEVMWKYQSEAAMKIVEDFIDVYLIKNNIIINPKLITDNEEEDFQSIHREIEIDKSEWGVPL